MKEGEQIMKFMRYLLIIGLMMMGSFAQADICSGLWWESAKDSEVEFQAEFRGRLAMNVPCPDGILPLILALGNNEDPLTFNVIMEHFDLDEETRHQVKHFSDMQLRQAYEGLLSDVGSIIGGSSASVEHVPVRFIDIPDEYELDSLDENIRYQIEHIAGMQLRQAYRDLLSSAESIAAESGLSTPAYVLHAPVHFFDIPKGYEYEVDEETQHQIEHIAAMQLHQAYGDLLLSVDRIFKGYRPDSPSQGADLAAHHVVHTVDVPDANGYSFDDDGILKRLLISDVNINFANYDRDPFRRRRRFDNEEEMINEIINLDDLSDKYMIIEMGPSPYQRLERYRTSLTIYRIVTDPSI